MHRQTIMCVLAVALLLAIGACRGTFRGNVTGTCKNQVAEVDGTAQVVVPLDGEGSSESNGNFRFKGRFKSDERPVRKGESHWNHEVSGGIEYDW